jgi:hypothetical protein
LKRISGSVVFVTAATAYKIDLPVLWRGPVPNKSGGMIRPVHGVILHIMDGTLWGTDGWFHNKISEASSDYGVGKKDTIIQWVDWTTNWKAWAEAAGNPYWVSIEFEGKSGEPLTPFQLEAGSQIIAHVFSTDNVPYQNAERPVTSGSVGTVWAASCGAVIPTVRASRSKLSDRSC